MIPDNNFIVSRCEAQNEAGHGEGRDDGGMGAVQDGELECVQCPRGALQHDSLVACTGPTAQRHTPPTTSPPDQPGLRCSSPGSLDIGSRGNVILGMDGF